MATEDINIDVTNFGAKTNQKLNRNSDNEQELMEIGNCNNKIYDKIKNNVSSAKQKTDIHTGEIRKIVIPFHRYAQLKENWSKIYEPIVKDLQLNIRYNPARRRVEIKTCPETNDNGNLQKAADFIKAFIYGFDVEDAKILLRIDSMFIETFEIKDVKNLKGAHKSRAIGRLAGKGGRTKFTIENATKTRIVLADSKIHILGSFESIQFARRAICDLIIGSPPSTVYGQLKNISSKTSKRV